MADDEVVKEKIDLLITDPKYVSVVNLLKEAKRYVGTYPGLVGWNMAQATVCLMGLSIKDAGNINGITKDNKIYHKLMAIAELIE